MNFKSQISTTREQSQRLLTLGVKPETADMMLLPNGHPVCTPYSEESSGSYQKRCTPSWSLSRLLEMMPEYIMDGRIELKFKILYPAVGYFYIENECYYSEDDIFGNCVNMIALLIDYGDFNEEYLIHSNSSNTGKEE